MPNPITNVIVRAIKSDEIKNVLNELNTHFYNRKHEGRIRDAITVHINNRSRFYCALSEHPKNGRASVDLSIYQKRALEYANPSTVEFKHHYFGDITRKSEADRVAISADMTRKVGNLRTSHFVLILQYREYKENKILNLKFMNRNERFDQERLKMIVENKLPRYKERTIIQNDIDEGPIHSTYTFIIYEMWWRDDGFQP